MSAAHTVRAPAERAGAHSVRAHNLAVALHQVVTAPEPVSRAGIAAATGLSRATASRLVDALVSAQLIAELPPQKPVGAGRPAAGLVVSPSGPAGLGLEINVDYLAACVVDLLGTSRCREVAVGDQRGRQGVGHEDDRHRTGRQVGLGEDLAEQQRGQRRLREAAGGRSDRAGRRARCARGSGRTPGA